MKKRFPALLLAAFTALSSVGAGTLSAYAAAPEESASGSLSVYTGDGQTFLYGEQWYTFADLNKVTEWGVSSSVSDSGALEITFDGQYQSQFYSIPPKAASFKIKKMAFTVTSGNADQLAFKLHTQADFDSDNKGGTPVSYGNPEIEATEGDVRYFSIMSLNSGTTEAVISGVTFYVTDEGAESGGADSAAGETSVPEGENLIVNGDFADDDLSMWAVEAQTAEFARGRSDTPIAGDIATYGIIRNRGRSYDCFAQDITGVVKSGHTYAYEFYAMLSGDYEGAPADQRQVDFAPYIVSGSDTSYLGSYSSQLSGTVSRQLTPGEWTKYSGTFKIAAAGNVDKVVIRLLEQGTNYGEGDCVKGEYYVTAVSLVDMNITESSVEKKVPDLKDTFIADFGERAIAGTAITGSEISDVQLMELVTKHFNAVTLGNELKPDSMFGYSNRVCPRKETAELNGESMEVPVLDYSRAERILDCIYDWNLENPDDRIMVRGHVLLWHSQTPEWFFHEDYDKNKPYVTPEVMNKRLEWYIKTMLTHFTGEDSKYKGMFYGWDVVNEAVSDATGTYRSDTENGSDKLTDDTHGSKSSWWAVYKSNEFIINAFRYANKYAPADVELYYNDYNDSMPYKTGAISALLKAVKDADGTRIDGMGMQAHYSLDSPTVDQFTEAARQYATIVGSVQLTEFDVKASMQFDGTAATLEDEYTRQAYRYKELYDAMKLLSSEGVNVRGMTVWGVIDGNSWLQGRASVGGGADGSQRQCPLFFDDDYHVKPCYWAIVDPARLAPVTQKIDVFKSVSGGFDGAKETTFSSDGVTVSFAPIWDDTGFKVRVTVKDGTDNGADDSVTLYLDRYNSRTSGISPSKDTKTRAEGTAVDGGYQVVLEKELKGTESAVGFDIVVSDGEKTAVFNDTTGSYVRSSKYYAEALLKNTMSIPKGTAVIGAETDESWAGAENVGLGIAAGAKAKASARLLWDEEALYVQVTVTDSDLNAANEAVHEQDSVEIFVDETNSKESSYNAATKQYRINYKNELSFNGENCNENNIISAVKLTDSGYIVEAAIKWTEIKPSENTDIGIELQLNDADSSGARIGTLNWYDDTNNCWSDPSCYGTAALIAGAPAVSASAENAAPEKTGSDPAKNEKPGSEESVSAPADSGSAPEKSGGDSAFPVIPVVCAAAAVCAVAVIVVTVKKKNSKGQDK